MTSFDALLYKIWPYIDIHFFCYENTKSKKKNYIKSNKRLSLSAKHFYATDEHFQELSKTTRSARPSFFLIFFIITIRFSLEITNHRKKCHFHNINERQIARLWTVCSLLFFISFLHYYYITQQSCPFFACFCLSEGKKSFLANVFKTKS